MLSTNHLVLVLCCFILFTSCKNEKHQLREVVDQQYESVTDLSNETELFTLLDSSKTNIDFVNLIPNNPDMHFKNYAYIYNGAGIAVGDINNDGLQDIYFGANSLTGRLYINQGDFKFKDVTKESGLENNIGFRTGVNMADVNGDGFLDIYICAAGLYKDEFRRNLLYINNGDGTFNERAKEFGIASMSYSTQSYFFDIDRDGDLDLYLLNHPLNPTESNNLLMESDKNGKLKVVLPKNIEFTTDRLYRNDNNKFVDITEKAGILNDAFGLSAIVADFNNDLYLDIYVCNDYVKPDNLYINNGDGTFSDKFNDYFQHTSFSSMGSDYADINNDGCLDLMTLDMFPEDNYRQKMHGTDYNYDKYLLTKKFNFATQFIKNTLQLNNCDGTYSDIAMMADVAHSDWSWSSLMADYDNDGWKDIFVTNGYRRSVTDNDYVKYTQDSLYKIYKSDFTIDKIIAAVPQHKTKSYLYKNNGNLTFSNVSNIWNSGPPEFSNGAVYVDLNNDGYLDIITNNIDAPPHIMKNEGSNSRKNGFINFTLEYEKGKSAYGTKVEITDETGKVQSQLFYPNRGFMSSVEPTLHFGLGKATTIKDVKVYWPNGKLQNFTTSKINALNKIVFDSKSDNTPKYSNPNQYFALSNELLNAEAAHVENEYIDFKKEPLLHRKFSDEGPALASGDVNGDGLDDFYLGGSTGFSGKLFLQQKDGSFDTKLIPDFDKDKLHEDVGAVFGDFNGDKFLDLIIISGGNEFPKNSPNYQDRLYLGDGKGNFTKSSNAMPIVLSSKGSISVHDIDKDGDLDVFVGGRVVNGAYPTAPVSYIAINDKGKFTVVTDKIAPELETIGMVTSSTFCDIDKDGTAELVIVGDWMPVTIFSNQQGKFVNVTNEFGLSNLTGWWEYVTAIDIDGDGYEDLLCGNAGLNTQVKASYEKPVTIHYKDYDGNKSLDAVICYYNGENAYPLVMRDKLLDQMIFLKKKYLRYRQYASATFDDIFTKEQRKDEQVLTANILSSVILRNKGGKTFEVQKLPNQAQISMIKTAAVIDLNKDGKNDIITAGNFFGTEVLLGRYDSSVGCTLISNGDGSFKTIAAANSGLNLFGDTRKIAILNGKDRKYLIAAKNNDKMQLYAVKN